MSQGKSHPFKPDATYHTMNTVPCSSASTVPLAHHHHHHHHHHHQNLEPPDLMEHIGSPSLALMPSAHEGAGGGGGGGGGGGLISSSAHPHSHMHGLTHLSHQAAMNMSSPLTHHGLLQGHHGGAHQCATGLANNGLPSINDSDTDPRELEAFAERFKQRRIKLGVTQADVGGALANLKIPGRGLPEPKYHLSLRVSNFVAQQHDRAQTHPPGVAGGGRGRSARENEQTRHFQWKREEAQADLHSGPGEALSGGVLHGAAPAVVGENRGYS